MFFYIINWIWKKHGKWHDLLGYITLFNLCNKPDPLLSINNIFHITAERLIYVTWSRLSFSDRRDVGGVSIRPWMVCSRAMCPLLSTKTVRYKFRIRDHTKYKRFLRTKGGLITSGSFTQNPSFTKVSIKLENSRGRNYCFIWKDRKKNRKWVVIGFHLSNIFG